VGGVHKSRSRSRDRKDEDADEDEEAQFGVPTGSLRTREGTRWEG
jgi:hypothetical protein